MHEYTLLHVLLRCPGLSGTGNRIYQTLFFEINLLLLLLCLCKLILRLAFAAELQDGDTMFYFNPGPVDESDDSHSVITPQQQRITQDKLKRIAANNIAKARPLTYQLWDAATSASGNGTPAQPSVTSKQEKEEPALEADAEGLAPEVPSTSVREAARRRAVEASQYSSNAGLAEAVTVYGPLVYQKLLTGCLIR